VNDHAAGVFLRANSPECSLNVHVPQAKAELTFATGNGSPMSFPNGGKVNTMRTTIKLIALSAGILAWAEASGPRAAVANEEPRLTRSARGGTLATVGSYRFEVLFYPSGVRLFPQAADGAPLDAAKLSGTATFYHPNSPDPWFARPLRPAVAGPGGGSESLDLALDLSTVPPTGARVAFAVAGLPDPRSPSANFSVPFAFVATPTESRAERPAPTEVHGYAPIASEARYFPRSGYYSTPEGVVWVPAPGFYHVLSPTQYFPPAAYRPPADWGRAHPAPWPSPPAARYSRPDLSGIQTDYFWHSKAMDPTEEHEAWIRGQLRQKYGPGRGP
jgi:hypothetical protein